MLKQAASLDLRDITVRTDLGSTLQDIPAADAGTVKVPYRVELLDSINEVSAEEWDGLVGNGAITRSHAYLDAVQTAAVAGCRYFFVVVRALDGAIAAHACIYLVDTDFLQLMPRWLQPAIQGLRRVWPRLFKARITECAAPLVTGSSISVRSGENRARMISFVESAMQALARREGSRLLVLRDFFEHDIPATDFLRRRGYKRVHNLPLARIEIRWPDYAAYLDAMRSRYRKDVRRRLNLAAGNGQRVEVMHEFGASAAQWAEQAAAVCARTRSFKRETLNAAYYRSMNDKLGGASQMLVVVQAARRVAHGMLLCDAESTTATYFGREPGPPGGEWFQLINEAVRVAIERRSRWLNLGLGSYDAKTLVGAEIVPLFVYTRCTVSWLNRLIKLVPDLMRRDAFAERRIFAAEPGCPTSE